MKQFTSVTLTITNSVAGSRDSLTIALFPATKQTINELCPTLEDTSILEYSVESLVVKPFYKRLMRLVKREQEQVVLEIVKKCAVMRSLRLDMSSLGTETDLDSFRPREEVRQLIDSLAQRETPIEKMVTFKDILNLIRDDLIKCLADAHSPFDPSPLKTLVPDDLVAATIFTLTQVEADDVFRHLSFVQTFGTRLPVMNELAYSLVTFEVAFAYIRGYEAVKEEEATACNDSSSSPGSRVQQQQPPQPSDRLSPPAEDSRRSRSSSFMSYRTRDSRFDKHLKELSRLVDDISFTEPIAASLPAREEARDAVAATEAEADEDLG